MRGKRGWIRILEATVAVLIVSGVMLTVYSGQSGGSEASTSDYSHSLQEEILADIIIDSEKRLDVLRVVNDTPGDPAYDRLDAFVDDRIPNSFGYLFRVCELGDEFDYCKMDAEMFIATIDKDVFVEETVISSELGDGSDALYAPKKVRLFFWEGGLPEGFCRNDCSAVGYSLGCSDDLRYVVNKNCGDFDDDDCLEYDDSFAEEIEECDSVSLCMGGTCVQSLYSKSTCEMRTDVEGGCAYNYDDECDDHDGGERVGSCEIIKDEYVCWDIDEYTTGCELNPVCPDGYSEVSAVPCIGPNPTVGSLSLDFVSDGPYYSYINQVHYYNHSRVIREHANIPVSLDHLRVCLWSTKTCVDEAVDIEVDAGGEVILTGLNLSTESPWEEFTVNYSGTSNGSYVEIVESIATVEANWDV